MKEIKYRVYIGTILIISSLIILSVIFSGLYVSLQRRLFLETQDRLMATAVLGAEGLNTDDIGVLVGKMKTDLPAADALLAEQSAEYLRVSNYLNKIRSTNPSLILYAYILAPSSKADRARFVVDADVLRLRAEAEKTGKASDGISGFNLEYDIHDQAETVAALSQKVPKVGSRFIRDPDYNTNSLMGLAPIFDRKTGNFLGLLGVDISDRNYAEFISSVFMRAFVIAGILLGFIIFGSFFLAWRISEPIILLTDAVRRFGDSDLNSRATLNTSIKELFDLKRNFNGMADKIQSYQEHLIELNRAMERFVPEAFLTFLSKDSILDVGLGDQIQKDMTIMFSDIRGFTAISEHLTPKQTFNFLNGYLSSIAPIIRRHGGFIDKYLGDGIMAIFPGKVDDAVLCALDMIQEIRKMNITREKDGLALIATGTGIHCGTMMMGTIGEAERMQTTVIADSVNLASRLESMTKEVGSRLLISREVYNRLEDLDAFSARYIGSTNFKGKAEQVGVFEVFNQDSSGNRQAKAGSRKKFEVAVARLAEGRFEDAQAAFEEILAENPEDTVARWNLGRAVSREVTVVAD
ncbi:MAG TPA: adenylate/guanylate cyclase domain-containing protein [Treponemataceae bacterium]|nr:adenylate/guanylate cyclase domain-containing protein [Treponemataceae bacterium]